MFFAIFVARTYLGGITMRYLASVCALMIALISPSVSAQWLQTTGVATLEDGDTETARANAVSDAIKQALLYSGLELSSVQTLTNGVLTQDHLSLQAHGQVQQMQLLEEQQSDGMISVTMQIEVLDNPQQCPEQDFISHFALTRTALDNPQQARYGQIFDVAPAFTKQLYAIMSQTQLAMLPIPYFKEAVDVSPFFTQQFQYDENVLEYIRDKSNSQYVLLSQITDISTGKQLNNDYAFWQDESYNRYFNVEFALFDALSFEKIWQKAYQTQGPWQFEKTARIDVNSGTFWQSQYGRAITALSEKVMFDLNNELRCLPTRGLIQHIDGDQVVVNLGKANGLVMGQQLTLAHSSNLTTYAGKRLPRQVTTLHRVEVNQLYQHSAIATNIGKRPLANIQLNDLVLLSQ